MRRGILLALGVAVIVVGLLGYTAMWMLSGGGVDASVSDLRTQVEVNTLSLGEAAGDEATQSCGSAVPPPERWQLAGGAVIEREDGGDGDRTFEWELTVDGVTLSTGTVSLGRYESERITFLEMGEYTGDLDPGSNATAELAVSHDGATVATLERSVRVHDRSGPVCPDEQVATP